MTFAIASDAIAPRSRRALAATLALALSAAFCCSVLAQSTPEPEAETQQPTVQQIVEQQTQLRADVLARKGAFKDLTQIERDELTAKQSRILQLLDGRDDVSQLRAEDKIELFNHLQWVSAVVRNAEEDRQVCERSRTVGSNRFQVVCMTAREYREHKERARQSLRTAVKCQGKETLGCKNELGGSLGGERKVAVNIL
ncbi:MAG: hypothetical protein KA144_00195 [Xanthomonadaceae bacterium]|nr:hypothetical protein [Xanthomonadaceae bacterium]MCC7248728.1 hypothetical protein [Lysobacter sp.]